ncbi:hypothetical protein [Endothiovibrio diazotrophicus]
MKSMLFALLLALPLAVHSLSATAGIPRLEKGRTAVLITDPQDDFLRGGRGAGALSDPAGACRTARPVNG